MVVSMPVVLHVGYPKTGTSSLQVALAQNQKTLEEAGIYYPLLDNDFKQRYLGEFLLHGQAVGEASGSIEKLRRLSEEFAGTEETVVLSAEELVHSFIFREGSGLIGSSPAFKEGVEDRMVYLRDQLTLISNDIRILMYVREPVGLYISLMQEKLKRSPELIAPDKYECGYRLAAQAFERVFGGQVHIRPFDRSMLTDGDITTDFLTYLSSSFGCKVPLIQSTNVNDSLSAEAMYLLWELRRIPGILEDSSSYQFNESELLWRTLNSIEKKVSLGNRPQLREGIAEKILENNRPDLDFFYERGIILPVNDPKHHEEVGAASDLLRSTDFDDIFLYDPHEAQRLRNILILMLIRSATGN